MNNYRFTISYDGSRYNGWEHQKNTTQTIQGKIESVLAQMCENNAVQLIGAGRTDAGVHAQAMTANAHLNTALTPVDIKKYMNHYLPDDISINEVQIVPERFHSRYNAIGKTYRYTCYIGDTKPVFDRKYVAKLEKIPSLPLMREAAKLLIGTHDYASFCGNSKMTKSTVRTVDLIQIETQGDYLSFTFHGNGFLQYMIRILVGTLLEVGYQERTPQNMLHLLQIRDRSQAGFTAPPLGLCLIKVDYPAFTVPTRK